MHVLPMLRPHHDYRNGIPDLYSQGGFEMAWTDYMTLILGKLNAAVAGMPYHSSISPLAPESPLERLSPSSYFSIES